MKKQQTHRNPHHRSLPIDACPTCGTEMQKKRATMRLPINGEEIAVPAVAHLACPKCHEKLLSFVESKRFGEGAISIYRKKHGLLSADELRALRERLKLTQAQLAELLGLGANTFSRWEAGRNVQTAAMDLLLRLIRDLPNSMNYIRKHHPKAA